MDPVALMGEFIGLVVVVMIFSIPLLRMWTNHRKEVMQMQATITAEKAAQYATSNKELEDRVAVLERIVTDRGYDVATQIEALRDQRRVEELLDAPTERSPS
jgi:hypothetical protein